MPQNWKTLFNEARLEKLCSLLIRLNVPNFTNDEHFSKLFQAKYNNLVYYLLRLSNSLNFFSITCSIFGEFQDHWRTQYIRDS